MNILNELSIYFNDLTSPDWHWDLIATNLLVVTGLLFLFKYKVAWVSGVSAKEELAEKDNPAFGIVLGLSFLSFFLIMSAASTGDDVISFMSELKLFLIYGVAGMVMLLISKMFCDRIAMNSFCLPSEIRKGNIAAAIVDGGNLLATSLIIFTYMGWVKGTSYEPICVVAYGWILSQVLLSFVSWIRAKLYKTKNGTTLQDAIKDGNIAVAIRYTTYKISFAITPLIASYHYPYIDGDAWWNATAIFISSILLAICITILTAVVKRVVIFGVDYADEINDQKNIGLSVVEACFVIGLTYFLFGALK